MTGRKRGNDREEKSGKGETQKERKVRTLFSLRRRGVCFEWGFGPREVGEAQKGKRRKGRGNHETKEGKELEKSALSFYLFIRGVCF